LDWGFLAISILVWGDQVFNAILNVFDASKVFFKIRMRGGIVPPF
jgi:hypothetical protein